MKYLVAFSIIITLAALPGTTSQSAPTKILIFSKTAGFRHDSIPDGIAAIRQLGQQNGVDVDATEDPSSFNDANLSRYQAVVFLSTTGDVLDGNQQAAFERYIRGGGGFAGVHSATDTEYDWAWYGGLVGAYFQSHPNIQRATIRVENAVHPSTVGLPAAWERTDEWYNFRLNPRGRVWVLAGLDETTYSGGTMGTDHPICWCQLYDGGRSWYTAGGHTRESYNEPLFRQHLLGGIQYAAKLKDTACSVIVGASAASFRTTRLASESIAALFGRDLSDTTLAATITPLPVSLASTSVRIKDGAGIERLAPLFFVSPMQINFLIPANAAIGESFVTVVKANGTAPGGAIQLTRIAPSLFAANANGQGVAAGVVLRIGADGVRTFEPVAQFDAAQNRFIAAPIDLSQANDEVYLVLFGTGFRNASAPLAATIKIGGMELPPAYAGSQGTFAGLDQINVQLPRELSGRGEVEAELKIDGQTANVVRIALN
jgi:uncharacterized protein (TIGR03437 family)